MNNTTSPTTPPVVHSHSPSLPLPGPLAGTFLRDDAHVSSTSQPRPHVLHDVLLTRNGSSKIRARIARRFRVVPHYISRRGRTSSVSRFQFSHGGTEFYLECEYGSSANVTSAVVNPLYVLSWIIYFGSITQLHHDRVRGSTSRSRLRSLRS